MLCQDLLSAPWSQQQQRYNRERPRLLCSPEYPDTSPTAPSTQRDRDEAKYTERDHDNMKPQDRFSDIDAEGRGLHGGFDQCTLRPRGLAARASEASASLRLRGDLAHRFLKFGIRRPERFSHALASISVVSAFLWRARGSLSTAQRGKRYRNGRSHPKSGSQETPRWRKQGFKPSVPLA